MQMFLLHVIYDVPQRIKLVEKRRSQIDLLGLAQSEAASMVQLSLRIGLNFVAFLRDYHNKNHSKGFSAPHLILRI